MGLETSLQSDEVDGSFWLLLDGVPPQTWSHMLDAKPKVIGREESCDIVLVHPRVSRKHAEIWTTDTEVLLQDLGSRNGTLVEGKRISGTHSTAPESTFCIDKIALRVVDVEQVRAEVQSATRVTTQVQLEKSESEESVTYFLKRRYGEVEDLSKAQVRVLRMLLGGSSESEAATALYLSPNTVHSHVKAIYKILGVNSRASLMAKFIDPDLSSDGPSIMDTW